MVSWAASWLQLTLVNYSVNGERFYDGYERHRALKLKKDQVTEKSLVAAGKLCAQHMAVYTAHGER